MREILFRGKRVDNKEWVYGFYSNTKSDYGRFYYIHDENSFFRVDPSTVGQYTGLTDKNGNKIFEGDVLQDKSIIPSLMEVVYDRGGFVVGYGKSGLPVYEEFQRYVYSIENCKEVIGNIHDNPELMKGGAE